MTIIKELEKFGFAIQKNVIPISECIKMSKALDELKSIQSKKGILKSTDAQTVITNVHLEKPELFLNKISIPKVMKIVSNVLKDEFILSNFNASLPGKTGGKRTHIDSRIPISEFSNTIQIVATLCIDEFTKDNGGTIVYPMSHVSNRDPRNVKNKKFKKIHVSAPRGSIIYVLGQTWHDVGPNLNGQNRWGIIAYYSRWWLKPTFDFTKCGKKIFEQLNNTQKKLMGFTSIPPKYNEDRIKTLIPIQKLPKNYQEN
ncbi:MAG: hypothetical protein CL763_09130 [Chloroflexi bacterium]|nr:hypothetical protein [Chloroflexota bacterium]|tara:strand:- start:13725 stop:14495 length:771 start_codon:yes stop_codon:yes gene_type:complete